MDKMSGLDANQVLRALAAQTTSGEIVMKTAAVTGNLVPDDYDFIALTYVAAGNGAGEIETATYKSGGSGGTTVAVLTLTYDSSDRISSITRS